MSYLYDIFNNLFRGFPFYILTFSFLEGFFLTDWRGITLSIFIIIDFIINSFLKSLFKKINFLNHLGERPQSNNCGFILSNNEPDFIKNSYGMPSGHSQSFAMIATLMALAINNKEPDFINVLKIGMLILLTLGVMYSRVIIRCHTIIQTIVGAMIGVGVALILVKYYKNPFII